MDLRKGYKKTEVGIIPEDWEVRKIGEVLKVIGGGAFRSADSKEAGVKWLKIANVGINQTVWNEQNYLPKELLKNNENFLLKEGDFVMALTRPILDNKLKITCLNCNDVPALLNQRVGKIEIEQNNNIDFAYYLLQKYETINALQQSMAGTDPPNLSSKGIYNIICPVPSSKEEQIAIATILSDTDDLINNLEKLIAKKRNIKQGAMHELLKPKPDWIVKKLGEIADIKDGTHQTPKYVNSGIQFYSVENVTANNFIDTKFITVEEHTFLTRNYKIERGDILMTRIGSIGDCKYVDWDVNASFYVSLALLKIKKEYNAQFICHFTNTYEFKSEIELNSLQWAIPKKINLGQISFVRITLPYSFAEQTRIATILSDMDTEINVLETKLDKYRKIKLGMMQNLLTGKIRLV